jgi:hypothetical protein
MSKENVIARGYRNPEKIRENGWKMQNKLSWHVWGLLCPDREASNAADSTCSRVTFLPPHSLRSDQYVRPSSFKIHNTCLLPGVMI